MKKRRQMRGSISSSETSRSKYVAIAILVSVAMPEKVPPNSTGHLFVLLFFFLFPFVLRTKLCLFLLFLLALISFPFVAHIRFSLLEPTFPQWRLLSNATELYRRYHTRFQQPRTRLTRAIRRSFMA